MRIALVTRRFPPLIGGAEAMLRYLAAALADEGADVIVLTSRLQGLPAEDWIETPGGRSVRVVRLPTSPLRFVGTWLYMRNLKRWLETNAVDLAYVSMMKHDAFVAVGVGGRALAEAKNPPPYPPPQGGRDLSGDSLKKTRRKGFPVVLRPEGAGATGDVAWQSWGRGGRAIGRRCQKADAFVAISAAVRAELIAAGYDAGRIIDLPNGVPIPQIPWMSRADWLVSPHAVFVGRLAVEKGLHALMDAWPTVRRVFPDARLTLIGDGPERPALEARMATLGLGGSIELVGSMAEPGSMLRGADLFVLPSREEGMSIALLEAMALGIPLVASAIPGNLKLIDEGIHGRLARPDDPADLARALVAQWSDLPNAARMGLEARRRVVEQYSISAVARAHLDLFGRLVAKGHAES